MELRELIEKLKRVERETPGAENARGLDGFTHPEQRRPVVLRCQNKDEFVWVECELVSVEGNTDAPNVVLVGRVTPEQEDEIFTRIDSE